MTDKLFTPQSLTSMGRDVAGYTDAINRRIVALEGQIAELLGETDDSSDVVALTVLPPKAKFGLQCSVASATSLTISTGGCTSEGGTRSNIVLTSALTKTLSAFSEGNGGGGMTSAVAANTWYHGYATRKADGTADVFFDASPTAPAAPSGFAQWRRIFSFRTNGAAEVTPFVQSGNRFTWDVPVQDVNVTSSTTASSRTLSTPAGVVTGAVVVAGYNIVVGGSTAYGLITPLNTTDTAPTATLYNVNGTVQAAQNVHTSFLFVDTNDQSQVRVRSSAASVNTALIVNTLGWIDYFGEV